MGVMTKSRFGEVRMVAIPGEAGSGAVADIAKRYGIGMQTIDAWRRRYVGMDSDEMKRLRWMGLGHPRRRIFPV